MRAEDNPEFQWSKPRRPNVTKCCGSIAWTCLSGQNGGDLCHTCNLTTPDNIRVATAEDMRKNGINVTDEEFEEMFEPLNIKK